MLNNLSGRNPRAVINIFDDFRGPLDGVLVVALKTDIRQKLPDNSHNSPPSWPWGHHQGPFSSPITRQPREANTSCELR